MRLLGIESAFPATPRPAWTSAPFPNDFHTFIGRPIDAVASMGTDVKEFLKRQLPVLGVFALLIPVWTLYLHGPGLCIEGGTVVGFPWMFYNRCYGPPLPGGGQVMDPAEYLLVPLAVDLVFWYVVSMAVVFATRLAMRR